MQTKNTPPLVSVGMPVYNDEQFISEAIECIISQTFKDFELVISDNASTDQTGKICEEYARKDSRIVYIRQPQNFGAKKNFEYLLENAQSKYFMWAASDDRWDKEFIEILVQSLNADENRVMAFTPYALMNEAGKVLSLRSPDYSGTNAFVRLVKFVYRYDDGCIYSLYRREKIANLEIPVWWGMNRDSSIGTGYPLLCYILSLGDYHLVEEQPMMFARVYSNILERRPEYRPAITKGFIVDQLSLQLRTLNIFVISLERIYRAKHSIAMVTTIIPILFIRYFITASIYFILSIAKGFKRFLVWILKVK